MNEWMNAIIKWRLSTCANLYKSYDDIYLLPTHKKSNKMIEGRDQSVFFLLLIASLQFSWCSSDLSLSVCSYNVSDIIRTSYVVLYLTNCNKKRNCGSGARASFSLVYDVFLVHNYRISSWLCARAKRDSDDSAFPNYVRKCPLFWLAAGS